MIKQLSTGQEESYNGWWLRNPVAEAFMCARPVPRVVTFRLQGQASLMQDDPCLDFFGVRSCFMEPMFVPESSGPNQQPAVGEWVSDNLFRLNGKIDAGSQLRLTMEIMIDNCLPRLYIRHGFTNCSDHARTIAPWALNVFPLQGVGLVPWRTGAYPIRSFLFFFETDPGEPCLRPGKQALAVDFRKSVQNAQIKVGTNSNAGWAAYICDDQALVSSVPFEPGKIYPENDSTVTFYATNGTVDFTNQSFCEVEHLGPLEFVQPGDSVWLNQTLDIVTGIKLSEDKPDTWMETVLGARHRS